MPTEISEKTVIPLGFLLLMFGSLGGIGIWISDAHSTAAQARDAIAEIKQDRATKGAELRENLQQINTRLSHMEGILEELQRRPR